jgi:hypothetical protein
MDEKIVKIVASKLRKYEGEPMTQDKLESIREAVYSATKTNKSASFSNVKKWIKAARSMMKKQEKETAKSAKKPHKSSHQLVSPRESAIPEVSRKVEDSVNLIKEDASMSPSAPSHEVAFPKPQIVFDKVYLQSIKFDIAGIRQTMERVSRQLDKLEKELSSHGDD